MTIFSISIFLVPGTHCLAVQHATTRLPGPPSHTEAEGMLLRSLCFTGLPVHHQGGPPTSLLHSSEVTGLSHCALQRCTCWIDQVQRAKVLALLLFSPVQQWHLKVVSGASPIPVRNIISQRSHPMRAMISSHEMPVRSWWDQSVSTIWPHRDLIVWDCTMRSLWDRYEITKIFSMQQK